MQNQTKPVNSMGWTDWIVIAFVVSVTVLGYILPKLSGGFKYLESLSLRD